MHGERSQQTLTVRVVLVVSGSLGADNPTAQMRKEKKEAPEQLNELEP